MKESPSQSQPKTVDMDNVNHVIVIMSGKGGVGKSTVAGNLAVSFARATEGNVGILDADLHGPDIPKILGVEDQILSGSEEVIKPGYSQNMKVMSMGLALPDKDSPVVWRGPMKMKAIRQFLEDVDWGPLEYLIIDLPPGTGDEPLSISQLIEEIHGAIIVTTPQDVALLDSRKAVNFAKKLEMPVMGILENMSGFVCPHCGEKTDIFKEGGGEKAAGDLNVPFLGKIPLDHKVVRTGDRGVPFVERYPEESAGKAFARVVENCRAFLHSKDN
ncbi:MAG: Mrp/NBP35 family ATP-binding protein [Candidatus Bipolaricaulota bacterium]